jgi:hypothetical protein
MALNPLYITAVDLCEYFVDKSTGLPLAAGKVTFYQDAQRNLAKPVYKLTESGSPPVYTYTALPNPITLSSTGTFDDGDGNNIAVYYYPYDANGDIQLYYITVTNSLGVEQFVREAWPNTVAAESPETAVANISNMLTNPTFSQVLFVPANGMTITFTGAATETIPIAPGWNLEVVTAGASSVTVTRTSIVGSLGYPYNPPYTLTITPSGVTSVVLWQQLSHNPSIWAQSRSGATNGYVNTNILLAPESAVTITLSYSDGSPITTLLSKDNAGSQWNQFTNTVLLPTAANTDDSDVGFSTINLNLLNNAPTTFSNLQVTPLSTNIPEVAYEETPVNRQLDQMFNYYNPLLQQINTNSFLVGWDFPLNPAQPLGTDIGTQALGNNTSYYAWDSTIIFQTLTSGVAITRSSFGAMRVETAFGQFALIQYLPMRTALQIINQTVSVNVSAFTDNGTAVTGTISLWGTTNGSLPSTGMSNASLVTGLDANGYPTVVTGWTEIPRSNLGNAEFVMPASGTNWANYGFTGWNGSDTSLSNTATYAAIVVGFGAVTTPNYIDFNSISLTAGFFPTIPAPKTLSQTVQDCEEYFSMSFPIGTIPADFKPQAGMSGGTQLNVMGSAQIPLFITYPVQMADVPAITVYTPTNFTSSTGQIQNVTREGAGAFTSTAAVNNGNSKNDFYVSGIPPTGSFPGDLVGIHWTADARLGK